MAGSSINPARPRLIGGAVVVGVPYFLTPTWFSDLNHTHAATEDHTINKAF